jgi:hypothetical protein
VNYDINKKDTAKWLPLVKHSREQQVNDFTVEENRIKAATTHTIAARFNARSEME